MAVVGGSTSLAFRVMPLLLLADPKTKTATKTENLRK